MQLTNKQVRHLRALAHHLRPIVWIGNKRVTEGVIAKVDGDLEHHELIKVKLLDADRDETREAMELLSSRTGAARVQIIGHVLVLYRPRKKDPGIRLPT